MWSSWIEAVHVRATYKCSKLSVSAQVPWCCRPNISISFNFLPLKSKLEKHRLTCHFICSKLGYKATNERSRESPKVPFNSEAYNNTFNSLLGARSAMQTCKLKWEANFLFQLGLSFSYIPVWWICQKSATEIKRKSIKCMLDVGQEAGLEPSHLHLGFVSAALSVRHARTSQLSPTELLGTCSLQMPASFCAPQ